MQHAHGPLSERMAAAARELQHQSDPEGTIQLAAQLALTNIEGCDHAGISLVRRPHSITTLAATDDTVRTSDRLQLEYGEGPCLDAVWAHRTVHSRRLADDARWPRWGPRLADVTPARSAFCVRLFTTEDTLGALNMFSSVEDGFDETDRDEGLALAAHVAIAVAAAQEIQSLGVAMDSRSVIGQAMGIIMERYQLQPDLAFSVLTRLSQHSQVRVRDLALEIVETRSLPAQDATEAPAGARE